MIVMGVDPGPEQSGWVVWDTDAEEITRSGIDQNYIVLSIIRGIYAASAECLLAIEMIEARGMPVGRSTFETVLWIGRFLQAFGNDEHCMLIYRRDVKIHFCGSAKAKEVNIWYAVMDRLGGKEKAIGRKKAPGPLYGITSHMRSALEICLIAADRMK